MHLLKKFPKFPEDEFTCTPGRLSHVVNMGSSTGDKRARGMSHCFGEAVKGKEEKTNKRMAYEQEL